MRYVRKRDGKLEPFDQERITSAIWKAAKAVGGRNREPSKFISDEVMAELRSRFGEDGCPTVEEIQDLVEAASGHARTRCALKLRRPRGPVSGN